MTKFQEMGSPASGAIFLGGACFIYFFFLGGAKNGIFCWLFLIGEILDMVLGCFWIWHPRVCQK